MTIDKHTKAGRRVIGILAHVDAGKTTLSEAVLFRTGEIRKAGRVDHGDSWLDTDEIERSRGITIFSSQAEFEIGGEEFTLLDTPGHADFSAETERTLSVLDAAVLVISGPDGVQGHTETLMRLLKRRKIPTFLFVNKMDICVYKSSEVLSRIRSRFGDGCVDFTGFGEFLDGPGQDRNQYEIEEFEKARETFFDDITLGSEELMERLLEGGKLTDSDITGLVADRRIFPVFFGAALKMDGVEEMLEGLRRFCPGEQARDSFGARVYKIARDDRGNRLTFLKVTGGVLHVRDTVSGVSRDGEAWEEKVSQIRIYSGSKFRPADAAGQGQIACAVGLTRTRPGDVLGDETPAEEEVLEPFLRYTVIPPAGADMHRVIGDFRMLEEEDPKLNVVWEPESGELDIRLMGEMQLEILKKLVRDRFGYEVEFGAGQILYRETIRNTVEGVGHFEPLRHYAEVHLILSPGERGSGMIFDANVPEDKLDRNWQRLILTHLREREFPGVLTGSPITDMKITLASGRAHKKHTEGGDFRQATYRAVRNGLMQAESILLEPWLDFSLQVPAEAVGRVMTEIQRAGGRFGEPDASADGSSSLLTGAAPASGLLDLPRRLAALTGGKGTASLRLRGYEECQDQDAVAEAFGYDPERDVDNPADSVFCSHGSSDIVNWRDVPSRMHLPPALPDPSKALANEELVEAQVRDYERRMASDSELMAIFEKTYGKIKRHPDTAPGRSVRKLPQKKQKPAAPAPEKGAGARIHNARARRQAAAEPESTRGVLIVDGYNLIHAWPELEELSQTDFGAARRKLIEKLTNYAGFTRYEVTLVFDAYQVKNDGGEDVYHNVRVVFTKADQTADSFIERMTREIGKKRRVRVVTSDAQIQQLALGHGALRTSSREFAKEVESVENAIRRILEEHGE